jgi:hypothetical protein
MIWTLLLSGMEGDLPKVNQAKAVMSFLMLCNSFS